MIRGRRDAMTRWVAIAGIVLLAGCGGKAKSDEDADEDTVEDSGGDVSSDVVEEDGETDVEEDTLEVVEDVPPPECTVDGDCLEGLTCCDGHCSNLNRDPLNCSECGTECTGTTSFCDMGTCAEPPCDPTAGCTGEGNCCHTECCVGSQVCCIVEGPGPLANARCYDDTCPGGCPACM
jgi:hypothetical protein